MSRDRVEQLLAEALEEMGLDLSDPNLRETPLRVSKMYLDELFATVGKEFTGFKTFPNDCAYDQIILLDRIHFVSTCSHHFLPFVGLGWVAYIPKERLLGASKPARLLIHYAKRPQLQEALTHQVIDYIDRELQPQGCMVVLRATHGCMSHRGIQQTNGSGMVTSAIRGCFKDMSVKQEGWDMIKLSLMVPGV